MVTNVVLLSKPIWVAEDEDPTKTDIRTLVEIYGFAVESELSQEDLPVIEKYIEYLCGVSKWQAEGNEVDGSIWYSPSTGTIYDTKSYYVKKYMRHAKQEKEVSYCIYQTNKTLDNDTDGIIDNSYITSRSLWCNIQT